MNPGGRWVGIRSSVWRFGAKLTADGLISKEEPRCGVYNGRAKAITILLPKSGGSSGKDVSIVCGPQSLDVTQHMARLRVCKFRSTKQSWMSDKLFVAELLALERDVVGGSMRTRACTRPRVGSRNRTSTLPRKLQIGLANGRYVQLMKERPSQRLWWLKVRLNLAFPGMSLGKAAETGMVGGKSCAPDLARFCRPVP